MSAYQQTLRQLLPAAGLLGIGGGMIIGPLLLAFDTHPRVAAATSTLMVLFSASSAALSFGFARALNLQFALVFGLCCMVASLAGVLLVSRIVQRSGKARACPEPRCCAPQRAPCTAILAVLPG